MPDFEVTVLATARIDLTQVVTADTEEDAINIATATDFITNHGDIIETDIQAYYTKEIKSDE